MNYRLALLILPFLLLLGGEAQYGQQPAAKAPCASYYDKGLKKPVYTAVDGSAEFPGGEAAYQRYSNKNIKYPGNADLPLASTTLNFTFIIDSDGKLIEPRVNGKDRSDCSPFEKAYIDLLNKMPKWYPATCQGKRVASFVKRSTAVCFSED